MTSEKLIAVASAARQVTAPLGQHSQAVQTSGAKCMPRIVEMFGVPGVGKTTLSSAVLQVENQLARRELTAAWSRLSLQHQGAFLLRALLNFRCLASAARFALHTRLTSLDSLMRLVRLTAKTHWMRSHSSAMLLDQSYLQEIWSICFSAGRNDPDRESLVRLIRNLYAGLEARIVFVDADAGTASQRISGRDHGYSRLDGAPAADVEARLERMARLPHAIVAAAEAAGLKVERLDGSEMVEANAARLRKLISESDGQNGD